MYARNNAYQGLKQELALASRILLQHGVVDAFGHVSARHPTHPERFLMSRRLAPGLVSESDIREFGPDGDLLVPDGTPVFLERFIHSAIYAARPDVGAVVHSHSSSVISFGVVPSQPLRAVCHTCGFIKGTVSIFEIRDVAGGATDLLIRNPDLGRALAAVLDQDNLVLMRGHGSTVVGNSVPHAVYRAVYTEINARILSAASGMGPVTYISDAEAQTIEAGADIQIERNWDYWVSQLSPADQRF
jgi:ribulose-5-phosphate 4-epimerase/fuculose-1-phosphate aldolase